ncbi:unnamed protein product, partial [Closterium sp. NIES-53]
LVCLELYKVLQNAKASAMRNTFVNLALPLFSMAEPVPPKSVKHKELTWTVWDRWTVEGDLTMQELLDWFKAKGLDAYRSVDGGGRCDDAGAAQLVQGKRAGCIQTDRWTVEDDVTMQELLGWMLTGEQGLKAVRRGADWWKVEGDVTMQELLDWFKAKGLDAYSISCGQALLFNSLFPRHKERLARKVLDIAKEVAKLEVPAYRRHFDVVVACEDEEGEDVDVPLISIKFR